MLDISAQNHLLPMIVVIVMVAVGMELTVKAFVDLARSPRQPILGTVIQVVLFPLAAVMLLLANDLGHFDLAEATLLGVVVVAACPAGGFSNVLVYLTRGDLPLSVTLTMIGSFLSFLSVPLLFAVFGGMLPDAAVSVQLPVVQTLLQIMVLIVIPISVGLMLRARWPERAAALVQPIQRYGQMALYTIVGLLIYEEYDTIVGALGEGMLAALWLYLFTMILGYLAPRWIGLNHETAIAVACESSIRNLAVAFVVAATVMGRVDAAIVSTIYFIAVLVSMPLLRPLFAVIGTRWP